MTEASQKALDYAARKVGFNKYQEFNEYQEANYYDSYARSSIIAHAETLDELWAIMPPKTRGELFAEEMYKRGSGTYRAYQDIAAEMIDEGWEPKDD